MYKTPTAPLNIVGTNVKAARHRMDLTQAELAELVQAHGWNAPRSAINKLEMGLRCVTDYELVTLSRVLGVPVGILVRGAPPKMGDIFANSGKSRT